jgi:hypothetical protein
METCRQIQVVALFFYLQDSIRKSFIFFKNNKYCVLFMSSVRHSGYKINILDIIQMVMLVKGIKSYEISRVYYFNEDNKNHFAG